MSSDEIGDLQDHAFDMAMSYWCEEMDDELTKEYTLSEAAPALNQIAKEYNLKLGVLSDFRIARAIWAKSLKRVNYE